MGKSKRQVKVKPKDDKSLVIGIEVPDEKIFSHITNAYGLVCQYRTANKVPHERLESWLLRLVVEGCNALYGYHNQQLAELEKKKQQAETNAEKAKEESDEQGK